MGGKAKAPAPDPNIGVAQTQMADIARQQLELSKEQWYAEQPRLDRYADLADQFVRMQQQAQDQQSQLTADYQTRMQGTFYPIEDTLALDSLGYYDASPEQQQKIEQAYLAQNKSLVNQRYDDALSQENLANQQRMQSFQKQIGALNLGSTNIDSAISAAQQNAAALETQLAGFSPTSSEYRALQPQVADAKERLSQLNAAKNSFSDYLTPAEGGGTLADQAAQQRIQALETQRQQALGNVGGSLDPVRAYADTYRAGLEKAAGEARQDVANQFDTQGLQLKRQLASYGVDPTSGRFAAIMNANKATQAATEANAMNQARNAAKQLGWAKRMDAAGLGRGLPGSQATSAGLAMQLGQGGLSGQSSVSGMNQAANSALMSGLSSASSGFGALGNLSMQKWQQQVANANAQNQGSGALTGALLGFGGAALGGPLGGALGSAMFAPAATGTR